jgi:hypothetical protein
MSCKTPIRPDSLVRSGTASHLAKVSVQHLHKLARKGKLGSMMLGRPARVGPAEVWEAERAAASR